MTERLTDLLKRGISVLFTPYQGRVIATISHGENVFQALGDDHKQAFDKALDLWGQS